MAGNREAAAIVILLTLGASAFCGDGAMGAAPGASRGLPGALYMRLGKGPEAPGAAADAAPGAAADAAPGAAADAAPGAFPPLADHAWGELYDVDMPAEDAIRQFMEAFLTDQRDWMASALRRMRPYRRAIEGKIAERRLPREILYLPLVESGYQARAMSPRGASGLWQLMRATAEPYGLRMDGWVDERRDFLKATDASLRELELNHRIFGNWAMALAAYNCGSGYLSSVARKAGVYDYWTLRRRGLLPRETAGFVPQFLALARIGSHPGRHGFAVDWEEDTVWERIPLSRSVDLRILAQKSGVPYEVLRDGNAELAHPLTPPRSYGWQLKVPAGARKAVETALADAAAPLLEFTFHVVKAGDTLSQIALDFGVTVELLQEFNPGIRPLALQIGAALIVPLPQAPGRSAS